MTTLPIIQIGHPTLRERAREVTPAELDSAELHRICGDLVETMRGANGAGLAAPQVDIPLRLFAVEVGDNPRYPYKPRLGLRVLVNPVVRPLSDETYASYEGCLSIPDIRGLLSRSTEVEVTYLDPSGNEHVERELGDFRAGGLGILLRGFEPCVVAGLKHRGVGRRGDFVLDAVVAREPLLVHEAENVAASGAAKASGLSARIEQRGATMAAHGAGRAPHGGFGEGGGAHIRSR